MVLSERKAPCINVMQSFNEKIDLVKKVKNNFSSTVQISQSIKEQRKQKSVNKPRRSLVKATLKPFQEPAPREPKCKRERQNIILKNEESPSKKQKTTYISGLKDSLEESIKETVKLKLENTVLRLQKEKIKAEKEKILSDFRYSTLISKCNFVDQCLSAQYH